MKAARSFVSVASLLLACLVEAQATDCAIPAGRIVKVAAGSKALIRNPALQERAVLYGGLLFARDRFEFDGGEAIVTMVYGKRHVFEPGGAMAEIPARDAGPCSAADGTFLDAFRTFLTRPRQGIPVFAYVRDTEIVNATLQVDPLLPSGLQLLPKGAKRVALLWRGGAANVQVGVGDAPEQRVSSGRESWVVLTLPEGNGPFVISIPGQVPSWTVQRSDQGAPTPPWFTQAEPASEAQQLVREAWLLKNGPPEWRAFALAELEELAQAGNFVADQLWIGARAGELPPAVAP